MMHFASLLASLAVSSQAALQRPNRPHIILLVLDDIGWADVGYHGSNIPTPHIDALVRDGVELNRMYAMPQCSPTRSAIMTGRWAWTTGLQHWTTILPGSTAGIPQETVTLAEVMQKADYDTHAIGKWHLGYSSKAQHPTSRGFSSHLGYLQGQVDYYDRTVPSCGSQLCMFRQNCKGRRTSQFGCSKPMKSPYGDQADAYDFWNAETAVTGDFGKYTQHSYMDRFEQLLANSKAEPEKPLFVYFAQQLLHIPLQLPDEPQHLTACQNVKGGSRIVNRTVLCSMASKLDETIGQMVHLLQVHNMYNNTLIWAYSDNGGMTHWGETFPASASSNYPLRGGKTTVFEGGVRSVAWVAGGALPAAARGTRRQELLHAVDILPTLAGLAGLQLSEIEGTFHGEDVWGTIIGANGHITQRMELPLNIAMNRDLNILGIPQILRRDAKVANYTALIKWPWKLILGDAYISQGQQETVSRSGWWAIDNYSYMPPPSFEPGATGARLFNLEEDEGEHHDMADRFPEIVRNMSDRIYSWWLSSASDYRKPQLNVWRPLANPRWHNWTWGPFFHIEEGEAHVLSEAEVAELQTVVV
eukprot:TRINITY_DN36747_c0_g1_i1.p1 TRINITY_DN36747_c0_g1~~TRINITY_DN36747_c0_g1_i1.p1  ORF type:complete len:586 (+),score=82.06 TRINITY_DN36747_c0_g1_i1:60-1817(+)